MSSGQLRHLHAWHIPKEMMENYIERHRADPEVFIDFTTQYRRNELMEAVPAYGGLMNGPTWQRFIRWWHATMRTNTKKSAEEKETLKYALATYLDKDGWNYINGLSRGCTTFVGPGDVDEYKEINYLILQACNYYEQVDSEHWTSPLLTALRENKQIPLTSSEGTTFRDPADETKTMSNYDCIDYMIAFGATKTGLMESIWKLSEDSAKTTKSNVDMKATMEVVRGAHSGPKRSRL